MGHWSTLRAGAAGAVLLAAALGGAAVSPAVAADEAGPPVMHRGIVLAARLAEPGAAFDVTLLDAPAGIARIRRALDLIKATSAFSTAAIDTLKRNGRVIVLYDPNYPPLRENLLRIKAAAFVPTPTGALDGAADRRGRFLSVIGRHGIKWPLPELAGLIVHELAGHGTQQLQGRMTHVPRRDLECEARLYQERFYQDLALDKFSRPMIVFRRHMEEYRCAAFKRHMRRRTPPLMALWDRVNPDVPGLLAAFGDYTKAR